MNIHIFNDENRFISANLQEVTDVVKKGPCSIALSGGSTPQKSYRAIGMCADTPLDHVEFFQVDERYIPADHADSNQKMILETLKPPHFHTFDTSLPIEDCLKDYESQLPKEGFDLIFLGIGSDGHTASLFPDSQALQENARLVAHTTTDQFAIQDRLTLTFPAIMNAKKLLILLKGEEKQKILNSLVNGKSNFPATKLLTHPDVTIHLVREPGGR